MEIFTLADKKEFIAELAELHHAEWKHLNHSLTLEDRAEAIAEAARSNVNAWYLYTEFASRLYEKLGWLHMERCEYKGVTIDVMRKQITP